MKIAKALVSKRRNIEDKRSATLGALRTSMRELVLQELESIKQLAEDIREEKIEETQSGLEAFGISDSIDDVDAVFVRK